MSSLRRTSGDSSEMEMEVTPVRYRYGINNDNNNLRYRGNSKSPTIGTATSFNLRTSAIQLANRDRRNNFRRGHSVVFGRNAFSDGDIPDISSSLTRESTPLVRISEEDARDGTGKSTTRQSNSSEISAGTQQPKPSTCSALIHIIFGKYVSILLLLSPLAVVSHYMHWPATYIFWLNFLVMIPLASILGDFTEEAALHTNETVGGLLNATFGNAVEVVVAIQALLANEIRVVQSSMLGSIFSNLLLVLGCCFFFGGLKYSEQSFNPLNATANMALLSLSSIALVLPTPFAEYYNIQDEHALEISRFAACFLLIMYIQLLVFQLYTHAHIFEGGEKDELDGEDDEDEEEEASVPMSVALIGLGVTTLSVAVLSDYLVASIDEFCETSGVSRTFVGLILLPIVGNAVEHITAVTVAMKNKMDLAMGVAVGSCTQISLFVVPLTVLVGWIADRPMTLNFPHFEIILYILSVFTVCVCLGNGNGNWLLGSLLITTYVMIAVAFWFENVEVY